jgi:hypothetical protein
MALVGKCIVQNPSCRPLAHTRALWALPRVSHQRAVLSFTSAAVWAQWGSQSRSQSCAYRTLHYYFLIYKAPFLSRSSSPPPAQLLQRKLAAVISSEESQERTGGCVERDLQAAAWGRRQRGVRGRGAAGIRVPAAGRGNDSVPWGLAWMRSQKREGRRTLDFNNQNIPSSQDLLGQNQWLFSVQPCGRLGLRGAKRARHCLGSRCKWTLGAWTREAGNLGVPWALGRAEVTNGTFLRTAERDYQYSLLGDWKGQVINRGESEGRRAMEY